MASRQREKQAGRVRETVELMPKLSDLWRPAGWGEHRPSGARAGGQRLLARPEVFRITSVIIPAIAVQFYTVLVPVVVGFPFFPEAVNTIKAVSPLLHPEPTSPNPQPPLGRAGPWPWAAKVQVPAREW